MVLKNDTCWPYWWKMCTYKPDFCVESFSSCTNMGCFSARLPREEACSLAQVSCSSLPKMKSFVATLVPTHVQEHRQASVEAKRNQATRPPLNGVWVVMLM